MLNFGLADLRLVAPRDGWPNSAAQATASGADLVLERAQIHADLDSALADCAQVVATTARPREVLLPVLSPAEAVAQMRQLIASGARCAVMFGAERAGLSNDEIVRADAIVSIPVNPAFASLNIAQAALVVAYEWAKAEGLSGVTSALEGATPAAHDDREGLARHLIAALDAVGYFHPHDKRPVMERNLRAALARAPFTESEVRTLRGAVRALQRGGSDDVS
jgi:tRNA/rRNA methyltransferase